MTHLLKVRVPDVDAAFTRACASDARVLEKPTTYEYGERSCVVEDPAAHRWELTQPYESSSRNGAGSRSLRGEVSSPPGKGEQKATSDPEDDDVQSVVLDAGVELRSQQRDESDEWQRRGDEADDEERTFARAVDAGVPGRRAVTRPSCRVGPADSKARPHAAGPGLTGGLK